MSGEQEIGSKRKESVALLSVASSGLLVMLKLAVGMAIGSVSVISEAIHSSVDLLAALIAFIAVKTSGKPADSNHPFGHGKVENVSGSVEALLIFLAAGWIIIEAAKKLRNPVPLDEAGWGVAVMLLSVAANILVSRGSPAWGWQQTLWRCWPTQRTFAQMFTHLSASWAAWPSSSLEGLWLRTSI